MLWQPNSTSYANVPIPQTRRSLLENSRSPAGHLTHGTPTGNFHFRDLESIFSDKPTITWRSPVGIESAGVVRQVSHRRRQVGDPP